MCLGIPARVVAVEGDEALVELAGARRRVSSALADSIAEGDYVVVHAGFIIEKIDELAARNTLAMIKEFAEDR